MYHAIYIPGNRAVHPPKPMMHIFPYFRKIYKFPSYFCKIYKFPLLFYLCSFGLIYVSPYFDHDAFPYVSV